MSRLAPAPRQFAQARARATYDALLAAARDVFADRGYDAAQTPEIAARANVAVGTLYRYFRDKRQVFIEMIGHHLAAVHDEVAAQLVPERLVGGDRRQVIDVVLHVLFAHVRRHPDLHRVFVEMSLRDPEVAALRARFDALGEELIAGVLALLTTRESVPDPRAAAHVVCIAAVEVTLARAGLRGTRRDDLDDEAVRVALREMIHRFMFGGER